MKKFIITIILICICSINIIHATLPFKEFNKIEKKADFRTAFNHLIKHEGWYVNHINDRGKETYGGISRKYNPQWWGWRFIDDYKEKNGKINRYTHFPELDFWVMDYYLNIWVSEEFYNIKDQDVANYVLDFRINGTIGAKLIKKTLREEGYTSLNTLNVIDSATIYSLNTINKERFLYVLKNKRISYYRNIVKRDSTQKEFLKHWIKRSKSINYE